jgi:hypothetical protein
MTTPVQLEDFPAEDLKNFVRLLQHDCHEEEIEDLNEDVCSRVRQHFRTDSWIAVTRYLPGVADSQSIEPEQQTVPAWEPRFEMLARDGNGIFMILRLPWSVLWLDPGVSHAVASARAEALHPGTPAVLEEIETQLAQSRQSGRAAVRKYYEWMRPGPMQRPIWAVIEHCGIDSRFLQLRNRHDNTVQEVRRSTRLGTGNSLHGRRR